MYIAFIIVQNPAFLALQRMFSFTLVIWIFNNRNILSTKIIKTFQDYKLLLVEDMQKIYSNIYLLFDI